MGGQIVVPTPGPTLQGPVLETFEPQHNLITSVTNSVNAEITTLSPHGFTDGMWIRIIIPVTYGMQLFEQTPIIATGSNTFTTAIDTTNLDPFTPPSIYPPIAFTPAQVTPMTGVEMNITP